MEFQFHKGAIRTIRFFGYFVFVAYFNSIKVRLEPNKRTEQEERELFQFHKGAIRTSVLFSDKFFNVKFQFHKGAIRTKFLFSFHDSFFMISIP